MKIDFNRIMNSLKDNYARYDGIEEVYSFNSGYIKCLSDFSLITDDDYRTLFDFIEEIHNMKN